MTGFSQGGHAALFVGLVASRYAPDLDFRGTVALAPPAHLPLLISMVTEDGARPVSVFLPFLLAGLRTSHPHFDARPFLTSVGGRLVDAAATASLVDMLRAIAKLTNDDLGITRLNTRPGVEEILHACRVPVTRMDRPVFVTAGTDDEVVPVAVVERFVADLGRADTAVRFHREEGGNHGDMLGAAHGDLIEWTRTLAAPPPPSTRFSLFDANSDGYLTLDDYEVFALRLAQAFGEPPGSPAALAVRRGYRALWQAVASRLDTDTDGRVSQAEFLAWLDSTPAGGFDQELAPLAEAVIALADGDRDGTLDGAEVARLLRSCDLSPEGVTTVFQALDRDHDAAVSAGELVAMVRDFCLDPVPGKPGHWLFGAV